MLPEPDSAGRAASDALAARIRAEIRAHDSWIPFARYMELALYAPGLGYYAGGAAKLGAGGDFVTAPELGKLFGRTLAVQLKQFLQAGDEILELGAGSGALAEVLVEELSVPYNILETSPDLRDRQQKRLGNRARWLERLPERFRGVMLANEVVDAMPVHAVAWTPEGVKDRGVRFSQGSFSWHDRPARGPLLEAANRIPVNAPYQSEIGLAARAWIPALGERLERGAILVVDYGFPAREYYHPQRTMGTLMCHYRHRAHGDVFFHPGLQDITAHVDFSALAVAAREAGLELLGYTRLAQFLVNCGVTGLLEKGIGSPQEANTLLSPAEMGELFKVIAFGRGIAAPLAGFREGDRSHAL